MKNIISSIPTLYNNVMFRSRLEAKWAAFFDEAKFDWEYEPIDLAGWIPDFVLYGNTKVYVEIKPTENFDKDTWLKITRNSRYLDGDILLLGNFVHKSLNGDGATSGWLYESGNFDADVNASEMMWSFSDKLGGIDFFHPYDSFQFRMSGEYDGDHHIRLGHNTELLDDIQGRLRRAQNKVQWKR